jgi:hypothetical protein
MPVYSTRLLAGSPVHDQPILSEEPVEVRHGRFEPIVVNDDEKGGIERRKTVHEEVKAVLSDGLER